MQKTSLPVSKTMLLYFVKTWVSVATLAAYKMIVHSELFGVLFKTAASGVFKYVRIYG